MSQSADGCKPVSSYFKQPKTLDRVTNAEVLFTGFLLEHNLPFEAASHAGHLFRVMIPDVDDKDNLLPPHKILARSIQVHVYGDKDLATIDVDDKNNLLPPQSDDWI